MKLRTTLYIEIDIDQDESEIVRELDYEDKYIFCKEITNDMINKIVIKVEKELFITINGFTVIKD